MRPGDIVRYRHPQTGERFAGLYTGQQWPEINAISVYVPGGSFPQQVISRANIIRRRTFAVGIRRNGRMEVRHG